MPKGYRTYLPEQDLLLPPSLRQWVAEDHLVYFVSDVVDQLDLSAMHAVYEKEKRGQPPYDPRLMTKLLVYGYCTGVFSSRRIQKRVQEDIPFKVLAAGNEPDFRTISDFRKIHIEVLQNLFEQVLALALECGAIKLGRVSLDGTKVKANASKHKAISYGRMQEKQQQLKEEVKQLLKQAEAADQQEDSQYGSKRGDELPEELRRRETRLAKIKEAKKVIEQESRQRPEAILADNGYCSEENLEHLESADQPERKIEGFIATGKQKHGEHRLPAKRGPLPKSATKVDRMKQKLKTKVGKAVYAARKCVVELVFGQIKQARGFRQFLLRGKEKVKGEWALLCLTHNILRLHAVLEQKSASHDCQPRPPRGNSPYAATRLSSPSHVTRTGS